MRCILSSFIRIITKVGLDMRVSDTNIPTSILFLKLHEKKRSIYFSAE